MYRYFAIVGNGHEMFQSLGATVAARFPGWTTAYEGSRALVMHTELRDGSSGAYRLEKAGGVVLGKLFRRDDAYASVNHSAGLPSNEAARIVVTGGQRLIDHYWGSYVAIIHDATTGEYHVLREPTGNLPCYHTTFGGLHIFFSHVEDCVRALPRSFSINRDYLIRWLIACRLMARDCGLVDIEDVPGGERVTLQNGSMKRCFLWNPVEIARAPHYENPHEAARVLRSTILRTVNAWASCYRKIAHNLSGGLDSSIVAGCLAQAPSQPELRFLHYAIDLDADLERTYSPGIDKRLAQKVQAIVGRGDERHFAHLVAQRWNIPLIETARRVSIDLTRMWEAPLMVSPPGYFSAMESDDLELDLAKREGVQAFFSGQAGDSVLLATVQPLGAIDYARVRGIRTGLWPQLRASATLSREPVWTVLAKALKHGVLHKPYLAPMGVLHQTSLLDRELTCKLSERDFASVWDELSSDLPPGKQNHIGGVAASPSYDGVYHSQRNADHIDPFNTQPVWEVALQIPTYTLLAGGVSRGLARQAFSDLLPTEIRKRQSKGTGGPFYQQVVRRNHAYLRENLLDGLLVEEGYLDRQKVEDCLASDEPFLVVGALDLLSYLSAEIWLRRWKQLGQSAAVSPSARMVAR